jgi:hypothetical protein
VLDCCFAGGDEALVHPSGQVEVARAKRWLPTEQDRGRYERSVSPGLKTFAPFGHVKPVDAGTVAAHVRAGASPDSPPARLTTLGEPQAKAVVVLPCLADETTAAATSRTNGLSSFSHCLIEAIRRLGANRSAIEILQATGHGLRQLGSQQTPLVMEPADPEHLGLRAFLTFQPVLFVHPASTPGNEEIAEAVRSTLINIKEGRSMQATFPGAQTFFGEDIGTIVNTVTPIVASMLQGRTFQQPYGFGGSPFAQGMHGGQGLHGAQGWPGAQGGWPGGFGGFGSPHGQPFPGQSGANLQPYEIAQIVNAVTPLVVSLLQSRGYQGHFGQFLPRAA